MQRAGAGPTRGVTHGTPGSSRKAAHRAPNPALGAPCWARRAQTRHIVPRTPNTPPTNAVSGVTSPGAERRCRQPSRVAVRCRKTGSKNSPHPVTTPEMEGTYAVPLGCARGKGGLKWVRAVPLEPRRRGANAARAWEKEDAARSGTLAQHGAQARRRACPKEGGRKDGESRADLHCGPRRWAEGSDQI